MNEHPTPGWTGDARRGFLRQLGVGAVALPWLAGAAAAAAGPETGAAVPIGGALRYDNDEVWSRLVALAGGPGSRFAVFGLAAGQPERAARLIGQALQRQGAVPVPIGVVPGPDAAQAVRDPAWIQAVGSCRGAFFAGGAQERITDTLQPGGVATPLLDAVWALYRAGGVVAGSSAGAAIMSETMFRDAQDVMQVLKGRLRPGREIDRGLGFVGPGLCVDQHFLKRGRIGRLLPLMVARGTRWGLGVEENSAAIVRQGQIEVLGARGAVLVDLGQARAQAANPAHPMEQAFRLEGARLSYLDRGDRYDLAAGRLLPSAAKRAEPVLDPRAPDFKPYHRDPRFFLDILGDNTLVGAMSHLIDSPAAELRGLAWNALPPADDPAPALGFEFRLHKTPDSLGWFTAAQGGEDYSIAHLGLDVLPVRLAQPLYRPL